jgi:hypothetical protein
MPAESSDTIATILDRLDIIEAAVGIGHYGGPPIGDDQPANLEGDRRLPAKAVARRYGVVVRTIDRWLDNPKLGFPKPEVVNNRRYWWLNKLCRWDRARIRQVNMKKAPEEVA